MRICDNLKTLDLNPNVRSFVHANVDRKIVLNLLNWINSIEIAKILPLNASNTIFICAEMISMMSFMTYPNRSFSSLIVVALIWF